MIDPISAISIASPGITVTTSPDYLLDALTASYVLLTLALAIIAFRSLRQTQSSLDLTRQQIELNKQQSQEASAASERHSQATIDAVNKQIAASEVQSNAAIEAINRQIAASQQQAQEALYNQHKPVVVPISEKIEEFRTPKGVEAYRVGMQNKGAGVALNAFGVLGIKGLPAIYCSSKIWFLVPDNEEPFTFKVRGEVMFPFNVFEEVNIFPQVGARLMITYNDAFSNKYGGPSPHWSEEEEAILRQHYATTSSKELMRLLPLRTLESMKVHASYIGIRRIGKKKEGNVRIFCLKDLEVMALYNLTPEEYHWKEGSRLVTPWHI